MARKHFESRAKLEHRMKAARQLRSETMAGAVRDLFAQLVEVIRRGTDRRARVPPDIAPTR